jgi:membrane protein YdbS with pleckstrin-like domain
MTETSMDPARIKAEYKARRTRQWLTQMAFLLVLVAFVGLGSVDRASLPQPVIWGLVAVAVVVLLAAGVYMFRNWRCPACDRFFRGELDVKQCPGCGAQMR